MIFASTFKLFWKIIKNIKQHFFLKVVRKPYSPRSIQWYHFKPNQISCPCPFKGVYFMYLSSISTHKVHPSIVMYADSQRQVKKEARWMTQIAVPIMAANLRLWNSEIFLVKFGQSRLSLSLLANFYFSFDKARSRSSLMFTFNQLRIDHWCFQTNIFHYAIFTALTVNI